MKTLHQYDTKTVPNSAKTVPNRSQMVPNRSETISNRAFLNRRRFHEEGSSQIHHPTCNRQADERGEALPRGSVQPRIQRRLQGGERCDHQCTGKEYFGDIAFECGFDANPVAFQLRLCCVCAVATKRWKTFLTLLECKIMKTGDSV